MSAVNTYLFNPTLQGNPRYIREGRCMQKASSWASAWPPVSLAILGAAAKAWGKVRLRDGNVEKTTTNGLLEEIGGFAPDLVVITTGFPSIDDDMAAARAIKERFPQVKVCAVGVFFTLLGKEGFERYPFLDLAIVGEPEETFTEVGASLLHGEAFHAIRGLMYREGKEIRQTPPRPFTADLDRLPHPDRSLLKNDRYRLPHNNHVYTLVNTARGCPFRCSFCIVGSYYGETVRKHSIPYVLDELRTCVQDWGIRDFLFWEEAFTLDKIYLLDFCGAVAAQLPPIRWAATTRAGSLDDEIVAAMKRSGCTLLGLGIENADQGILDRAGKKQTVAEIRHAVALCRKHRLAT
ncbi:MAG: radical SAM protein, partial [Chitinispirillaceae bacterium]|nr:radical SAM protein [Chitinispirillaceae bacterium]